MVLFCIMTANLTWPTQSPPGSILGFYRVAKERLQDTKREGDTEPVSGLIPL